jgi:transmembrane sensor
MTDRPEADVTDTPHIAAQLDEAQWSDLARYIVGEANASQAASVESWVAADPARARLVAELRSVWERTGKLPQRPVNVDAGWMSVAARMKDSAAPRVLELPSRAKTRRWFETPAFRMAASLLVLIGGTLIWRQSTVTDPAPVPAREYATAVGERRTLTFEDGTEVVLGVASRLGVAAGYGATSREMTLTGEALFRVRHDAARPFRVHAAGTVSEDLGTEFTIRAYRATDTVRVVVTEGEVAVRSGTAGDTGAVARAGQTASVPPGAAAVVSATPEGNAASAWVSGTLAFTDAPLSRVAAELERWYDVSVVIADSALASRRLTSTFAGDSLDDVVRVIELSLGVRAERSGRTLTWRAARPR